MNLGARGNIAVKVRLNLPRMWLRGLRSLDHNESHWGVGRVDYKNRDFMGMLVIKLIIYGY